MRDVRCRTAWLACLLLTVAACATTGPPTSTLSPQSTARANNSVSSPRGYVGSRNWWERLLRLGKWKDEADAFVRAAPANALALKLTRDEADGKAVRKPTTTRIFTQNGAEYRCGITTYGIGANFQQVANANPNLAVLYPGALVSGQTLHRGAPTPIALPRRPITVSIWPHPGGPGGSSRRVEHPSASAVNDAVGDLLRTAGPTSVATVNFRRNDAHNSEQVAIASGLAASYMGASIGSTASRNESLEMNTVVGVYDQVYYEARTDLPRFPSQLFRKVSTAELAAVMDSTNPLGYVTAVTFGRRAFIQLTSRNSHSDIKQAMSLAYSQTVGKDDPNAPKFSVEQEQHLRTVLGQSSAVITIIGGSGGAANSAVKGLSLAEWFSEDPKFSPDNPGFPIAYVVHNLGDKDLLQLGYTTDFDAFTCRPYEANLEVRFVGFKVVNGGDGNGGNLYWHVEVDNETMSERTSSQALNVSGGQLVKVDASKSFSKPTRNDATFKVTGNFRDKDFFSDDPVGSLDREFTFLADRWASRGPERITVEAQSNSLELLFEIREMSHPEHPPRAVADLAILSQPKVDMKLVKQAQDSAPVFAAFDAARTLPPPEALIGAAGAIVDPIPLDPQNGGRSILASTLRAGDLLFSTTSDPTSWAVRRFTGGGPVSHIRLYAGNGMVIEAVPDKGVVLRPLDEVLTEDAYTVAFRYPGIQSGQEQIVVQHAQNKLGQRYDRFGALNDSRFQFLGRTVFVNLGRSPGTGIYCSTLVLDAFGEAGLQFADMVGRGRSPNDMVMLQPLGSLEYVGHLKFSM